LPKEKGIAGGLFYQNIAQIAAICNGELQSIGQQVIGIIRRQVS
jgi:hypothetical protein